MTDETPTCGQGLAANASLGAKLGALIGARADVLEGHVQALDLSDDSSRKERDAYLSLVERHRSVAAGLGALADEMAGYRDLPQGRHDVALLGGQHDAFARYVAIERELLDMLRAALDLEQRMLAQTSDG